MKPFPWSLPSLKLTWPLKIGHPKRKNVFQPSIFRGYVSFMEFNPNFGSRILSLMVYLWFNTRLFEDRSAEKDHKFGHELSIKAIEIWGLKKMVSQKFWRIRIGSVIP